MPQPLENPFDPRVLPAPNQRSAYLANFLPRHPWRKNPEGGRESLRHMQLNERHPWLENPSVRAGGLTDRQIDLALAEYAAREQMRSEAGQSRGETWNSWLNDVLTTSIELLPAARVVLRDDRRGLIVSLRFIPTGKRKAGEPYVTLEQVELTSAATPPAIVPELIDLTVYFAAFRIELERIESNKTSKKAHRFYAVADRPEPGKPLKTEWYSSLLSEAEALMAEGHEAHARELAKRYGIGRSTLRGHLRKARELRTKREREAQQ